jgi:ATP-dependent DNA helicase RecG
MCTTTDGFKIAEKDMELRGPGDISGTRQSGLLDFKLADIVRDKELLQLSVVAAQNMLDSDPELDLPNHVALKHFLKHEKGKTPWSRIS